MDDGAHRENGRQKPSQAQWLMQQQQHQPSMKQIMALMAERDAAIQERNLALSEKKSALAERDVAILQRDSAVSERNNAVAERDNAVASLRFHNNNNIDNNSNNNNNDKINRNLESCPPGPGISSGLKHLHHHLVEISYNSNNSNKNMTNIPGPSVKPGCGPKRAKPAKKKPKPSKRTATKSEAEPQEQQGSGSDQHCNNNNNNSNNNKRGQQVVASGWKEQGLLGLNQVGFNEATMAVPVCSCTGVPRPCYKWGSGGWQSSCCTGSLSMYPLPAVPNKRHARVGGRKMSGGAFSKLLSRLASEGHDLSSPVDLRDRWAKHGTNRYITIK